MATLPHSLFWRRLDTAGSDLALVDDRRGLVARGAAVASGPVPHIVRYDLVTDEAWACVRLEVTAEGAGWLRTVRLERATGRWRVTTAEQGDLDAALVAAGHARTGLPGTEEPGRLDDAIDLDLGRAPLFNTLPVRRLGMLTAPAGTEHTLYMAFVRVPSLEVFRSEQIYTVLGAGKVRYASTGFTADLALDARGWITHYPGLAELASA
jgi:hypothetical protein